MSYLRLAVTAALSIALASPAYSQQRASVIPALDPADIDRGARACDDFNRYANGGWFARNPIPPAFASWGAFTQLTDRNYLVLRGILESAATQAGTTKDPATRKLGNLYASCMDSSAVETLGATPLQSWMQKIDAISSSAELARTIASFSMAGVGVSPFGFAAGQDLKNTTRVILNAGQGGLSLPDRDYYIKNDSPSVRIRNAYVAHVVKMFELLGDTPEQARAEASRVLSIETALANGSRSRVQLRDPNANYNLMTLAQLREITPAFDWSAYMDGIGMQSPAAVNVRQPGFFKALNDEIRDRPISDWKSYLRWRILDGSASQLSSPFVNQNFSFRGMTLTGARQMQPRWRRCLQVADGVLGDALGQEYLKTQFTPGAKAKMVELVGNLRAAMRDRIMAADWMSPETRKQALAKLTSFNQKIGYPEKWESYSSLEISRAAYLENVIRAGAFGRKRNLAKVGKPVDRSEWGMTVPTVNAYYSPPLNEIVFPAGRLQPPFFHVTYDDAANYGGVGGTIGHELSHGFDDSGRQFDAEGNLRDWWTAEDAKRYSERAGVVERQYADYTVLDSLHVNGKLTLGENLADVVGVSMAYDALQKSLKGKSRRAIDGFTPEQRYFLAYAQARRGHSRPEALRLQIQTDPHSPGQFRVNGPLSNMPEFARAFGCKEGDAMVRAESIRARIW